MFSRHYNIFCCFDFEGLEGPIKSVTLEVPDTPSKTLAHSLSSGSLSQQGKKLKRQSSRRSTSRRSTSQAVGAWAAVHVTTQHTGIGADGGNRELSNQDLLWIAQQADAKYKLYANIAVETKCKKVKELLRWLPYNHVVVTPKTPKTPKTPSSPGSPVSPTLQKRVEVPPVVEVSYNHNLCRNSNCIYK